MSISVHSRRLFKAACVGIALAAMLGAPLASAQVIPLHIGTTYPIQDEFGVNLQGSQFDDPALRDRVEILWATDGVFPPATDGTPDPQNPLVDNGVVTIGHLTNPNQVNPGVFGISLMAGRPMPGAKLFVRAFNAPTRESATFYGDSDLFEVSSGLSAVYDVQITTMDPLDDGDPDMDGLVNSWERSLGSFTNKWDSDGDGMNDGDEHRAGTDMMNEHEVFIMFALDNETETNAVVWWHSVVGKQYQVQHSSDAASAVPGYSNVTSVITATGTVAHAVVPNGILRSDGKFRIGLVEE